MHRSGMPWTLAVLSAIAANALAGDGKETRVSGTISLWGGNTAVEGDVIGARLQLHVPVGQGNHWSVSPGLGYGYGHAELTSSTPPLPSNHSQYTTSYWDTMLDFLYSGGDDGFYCGPGLFYSPSKVTQTLTGTPDVTFKPWTFGAQLTVGGGIPLGPKFGLTGSMTQRAGFTKNDRNTPSTESKSSGITHSTQFSVGLRVRF